MHLSYDVLIAAGVGEPENRHVFACALVVAALDLAVPLTEGLGLPPASLFTILETYFPDIQPLVAIPANALAGADAIEEPDLRRLLLDHRSHGIVEEEWLAAIVARRSLGANHLWQDLGLFHRRELSELLHRHFHSLAAQNINDMKWKKFFYRQLRARWHSDLQGAKLRGLHRLQSVLRLGRHVAGRPVPEFLFPCLKADKTNGPVRKPPHVALPPPANTKALALGTTVAIPPFSKRANVRQGSFESSGGID